MIKIDLAFDLPAASNPYNGWDLITVPIPSYKIFVIDCGPWATADAKATSEGGRLATPAEMYAITRSYRA